MGIYFVGDNFPAFFEPIKDLKPKICHLGELNFIRSYYKFALEFKKEILLYFARYQNRNLGLFKQSSKSF